MKRRGFTIAALLALLAAGGLLVAMSGIIPPKPALATGRSPPGSCTIMRGPSPRTPWDWMSRGSMHRGSC
jgi:hypothetical protein